MRYLLVGFYGKDNVGDNMLRETTKQHILEVDPLAHFCYLTWEDMILNRCDFASPDMRPDFVVAGGGGWFGEDGFSQGLIYSIFLNAKKYGSKIIAYDVGVNVIYRDDSRVYMQKVFDAMDLIIVRDQISAYHLKMIAEEDVTVASDMAITYPFARKYPRENKRVGLIATFTYAMEYYEAKIRFFLENGYDVSLIPFGDTSGDYPRYEILRNNIDDSRIWIVPRIHDMQNQIDYLLDEVSKCGIIVAHRLHGMVAAILTETPLVSLNYHFKMFELSAQGGLERYCVPMYNVVSELYIQEWSKYHYTHLEEIVGRITSDYEKALVDIKMARELLTIQALSGKQRFQEFIHENMAI